MKFCCLILVIFLISGCTPIYLLINKKKVKENNKQIRELSELIINDDYGTFLSRLTINNNNIYSDKDTLGFGYFIDVDERCYMNEICFGTQTVKRNDSIISMRVYPSDFRIRPIIMGHYKRKFKKAGWKLEKGYGFNFEQKICGFKNSLVTIDDTGFSYRPNPNPCIDSLMSPNISNSKCFNRIKDSLRENDLLYLMHSINPWTRLIVVKHIKCNSIQTSSETRDWINFVVKNSPEFKTFVSRCIMTDKPIEYFLDCK